MIWFRNFELLENRKTHLVEIYCHNVLVSWRGGRAAFPDGHGGIASDRIDLWGFFALAIRALCSFDGCYVASQSFGMSAHHGVRTYI